MSSAAAPTMRFCMLDRIVLLEPGVQIKAEKRLRPDEEYLKDHFPRFPVMPGVLMLEALFQSAMWLVRVTEEFQHSVVLLKEARNIRYTDFVGPDQILQVVCELKQLEGERATVKGQALVEGNVAVSGRLVLELSNLGDQNPLHKPRDVFTCNEMQKELGRLCEIPQPTR